MDSLVFLFQSLADSSKPAGVVASLIFGMLRLYRVPDLQEYIPAKVQWDNLSKLVRYGILVALSCLGGALTHIVNDVPWWQAILTGFMSLAGAISVNRVTQHPAAGAVGRVLLPGKQVSQREPD